MEGTVQVGPVLFTEQAAQGLAAAAGLGQTPRETVVAETGVVAVEVLEPAAVVLAVKE